MSDEIKSQVREEGGSNEAIQDTLIAITNDDDDYRDYLVPTKGENWSSDALMANFDSLTLNYTASDSWSKIVMPYLSEIGTRITDKAPKLPELESWSTYQAQLPTVRFSKYHVLLTPYKLLTENKTSYNVLSKLQAIAYCK